MARPPLRFLGLFLSASLLGQELPPTLLARPVTGCRLPALESAFAGQRWSGGNVPFEWAANVSPAMRTAMQAAMAELEAVANVHFVPRVAEPDWVVIRDSVINSSAVGRAGGPQWLHVYNWNSRFTMAHELMHVLGFWHEHQRPDRDQFVAVQTGNIAPTELHQFAIVPTSTTQGLPYDLDSVLHFSATEASQNGQPTLVVLPPNQGQQAAIGQRTHLSSGDAAALRLVYGSPTPPILTAITPGAVTAWLPGEVTLTGTLLDEATRVFFDATAIAAFTRPAPDQIRFNVPSLRLLGMHTVTVESQTGRSNALSLQVTGNDPPVLENAPLIVRGFPLGYRLHSDDRRTNVLVASFDNVPSAVPGVLQLGLGAQFTTLLQLGSGVGGANGQWQWPVLVSNAVPTGVNLYFQALVLDLQAPVLPLTVSNLVTTRTL